MWFNIGVYVDIIYNYVQENGIQSKFVNGICNYKNLEIKITGEKFSTCNFINIIMSITNKGSSTITYSINNKFDTSMGGDYHQGSGLPGYKGWRGMGNGKTVDFYFNNSYKVTSATSSYHTGFNYVDKEPPVDDKSTFRTTGLAINWENKIIKAGETQEIRYSIGYGEYIIGYDLNIVGNFSKSYEPKSLANLSILINDVYYGDTITIKRSINDAKNEIVYNKLDNGKPLQIFDIFKLPSRTGWHNITYTVTNNENISNEKTISILVNKLPTISLIDKLYKVYSTNEEVLLNVSFFDDTNCKFYLNIDSTEIFTENVICMSKIVNKTFKFKIPEGSLNSKHKIDLICYDEFSFPSNTVTHEYILNNPTPPEFNISNAISYIQTPLSIVNISGEARYPAGITSACFTSSISNKYISGHKCNQFSSEWSPFSIERQIPSIIGGIYLLSVKVVDGNNRPWPVYEQSFAIAILPIRSCTVFGTHMHLNYYALFTLNDT